MGCFVPACCFLGWVGKQKKPVKYFTGFFYQIKKVIF